MSGYRDYMDRQQVSKDLHDRLLKLEQQQTAQKKPSGFRWQRAAALAACLCLVVGLGWFGLRAFAGVGGSGFNGAAADCAAPEAIEEEGAAEEPAAQYDMDEAVTAESAPLEEPGEAPAEEAEDTTLWEEAASEEAAPKEETDIVASYYGYLSYSPEGYTFEGVEEYEDTQILRWKSETGDRITAQRIFASNETLRGGLTDQGYPIYLGESEDWKSDDAPQSGEMGWGFVLDWGDMLEIYTSTEGPEGLWVVVEELQSYEW